VLEACEREKAEAGRHEREEWWLIFQGMHANGIGTGTSASGSIRTDRRTSSTYHYRIDFVSSIHVCCDFLVLAPARSPAELRLGSRPVPTILCRLCILPDFLYSY
jgi:hypothetical protein